MATFMLEVAISTGEQMADTRSKALVIIDFWNKVVKTDGCWRWVGTTQKKTGYGVFRWKGTVHYCHRFSAELAGMDIEGEIVLHECDNPCCVNPDHLKIGTHGDNVADKVSKNRQQKGEDVPQSKLTEEQVRKVKQRLKNGDKQKKIALDLGVDPSLISKIKHGQAWGWLDA